MRRWTWMATLHRPRARWPSSSRAWVTIPTGLVKSTTHAPGAPRVGRLLGDLEDQGHRAEGLGQAARTGRLLAQAAEADRQCLVGVAGRLATHPELHDHEVGTVDGPVPIVGGDEVPGPASSTEHALGEAPYRLQPIPVRIEEDEFVHHHPVLVVAQAVHQLRCVGAPTPDHGHLGSHALNVTSLRGRKRGSRVSERSGPDDLILAVDGGASKTDVWLLATNGTVVGIGTGRRFQPPVLRAGCGHGLAGIHHPVAPRRRRPRGRRRPLIGCGVYCLAGVDLPVDEVRLSEAVVSRGWSRTDHGPQ